VIILAFIVLLLLCSISFSFLSRRGTEEKEKQETEDNKTNYKGNHNLNSTIILRSSAIRTAKHMGFLEKKPVFGPVL
jgi:hypothetical protein